MIAKRLILGILTMVGVIVFLAINADASVYYVRDGGGNSTQCIGTTNAVYPGSGTNKACAFKNPRYALGWDINNPQAGTMKSGDTLYIDGDSDINPGHQAQYLIGYDDTGAGTTPDCSTAWPWDCTLANVPAGINSSQPTSIIGTGTHKPQLWGNERIWEVLSADNNYITLQWLEITEHEACGYNNPVDGCKYGGSYPYGSWAEDGLYIGGTGLTLTDVYVHGLGRYGVNTDNLGSATFTRLQVIGNGYGGFTTGTAATISGTLTFNQPIIEWNGCVEAYPVTSVDNPSNYSQCFGQNSGGYGDGLAFGNVGHGNAGNWTIIGPGSISFNTQDGLDTLHGNGTGTIQIDKMRFEGNAGNQVKMNAVDSYLTNSIVIGDCGWWYGAPQSYSGFKYGDICRALGDAVLFNVTNGSVTKIYNDTIVSIGNVALESEDLNSTGCNSSTMVYAKNNIVLGGYAWFDDTSFNASGGNSRTTYIYNDGNNGNGGGSCGNLTWNEDYNIVYGTKYGIQGCSGANDKCGINPGFVSIIPMGTAGGVANTFYQSTAATSLVNLSSSSPAIASGVQGIWYWNNENDYHNVARKNPPSIGGVEVNSCAANSYGCFFNSDCCAGSCSNFICGTTAYQPVVNITSPQNGSSFTSGSNFTVTITASETNGTISNINLYNGAGVLLGSSKISPYSYIDTNVPTGSYTFTAVATDAYGVSTTSNPVIVTVSASSSPPVVAITNPANGSSFTVGANVTVTATASEINGTISKVSMYNPNGYITSNNSSPLCLYDTNLAVGTYTHYATATDANGVTVTSSPSTFTVTGAPVVAITSPANGSSFTVGANVTVTATASEINGTISNISIYNSQGSITSSHSSPLNLNDTNLAVGTYTYYATATDANGVKVTSSSSTFTVTGDPVVTITSPSSGSTFKSGSAYTVTSSASEQNGTISNISLYNGSGILLGSSSKSPYNYVVTNAVSGAYWFIAIATDANGVSEMANPIEIVVST